MLEAARHLSRCHEDDRALVFYDTLWKRVRPTARRPRVRLAFETAAAHARAGNYRVAARLLTGF